MLDKVVPPPAQPPELHSHPLTALQKQHVLEHYQRALPLMVVDFPHVPFVGAFHPYGLGNQPTFSGGWPELPETVAHVEVTNAQGQRHLYPGLTENAVLWLVHMGAVGVESWTPSPRDPESVGYARILLRQCGSAGEQELKYGMLAMRTALLECGGLRAIPVLDGDVGAALFGAVRGSAAVRRGAGVAAPAVQRRGGEASGAFDVREERRGRRSRASVGGEERGGTAQQAAVLAGGESGAAHGDADRVERAR